MAMEYGGSVKLMCNNDPTITSTNKVAQIHAGRFAGLNGIRFIRAVGLSLFIVLSRFAKSWRIQTFNIRIWRY